MTNHEAIAFLSAVGWLSRVAPAFRETLLSHIRWRRCTIGETIAISGDETGGIFGIAEGQTGILSGINQPDSPIADIRLPGAWLWPLPLFGLPRAADCIVMTPTLVGFVPLTSLRPMFASNPEWWEDAARLPVEHMVRYGSGMADLLIRDSALRCLAVLLRYCGCRFAGDAPVTIALAQDQLAAGANLSRHIAGEALRAAEADGMLALGYREITVLNPRAVRAMVNAG